MNESGERFASQTLQIKFLLFLFKESSFFIIEKRYLFMGQKTHPVSLRLSLNRTFDSLWYTDQYSRLLHQDQSLRKILSSVFRSCGFLSGRLFVQIFPKKTLISLCFHETNADRKNDDHLCGYSSASRLKGTLWFIQGFGSASISCGSRSRILKTNADLDPDTDPDPRLYFKQ